MRLPFPAQASSPREAVSPRNMKANEKRDWFKVYEKGNFDIFIYGEFGGANLHLLDEYGDIAFTAEWAGPYIFPEEDGGPGEKRPALVKYRWWVEGGDETTDVNVNFGVLF